MKKSELKRMIREEIGRLAKSTGKSSLQFEYQLKQSAEEFIEQIKSDELYYFQIIDRLDTFSTEMKNDFDIPFGAGQFEEWLEEQGIEVTNKDVKNLDGFHLASLIVNIFYNHTAPERFVSDKVVMQIADSRKFQFEAGSFDLDLDDSQRSNKVTEYVRDVIEDISV